MARRRARFIRPNPWALVRWPALAVGAVLTAAVMRSGYERLQEATAPTRAAAGRADAQAGLTRVASAARRFEARFGFPPVHLEELVAQRLLLESEIRDPWGHALCLGAAGWSEDFARSHYFVDEIRSAGPDGQWLTGDDATLIWGRPHGFIRGCG